jgi:hypothetical protein
VRDACPRARAMINANKISTFNSKRQFFSAGFYKGRERLRGIIFFRSMWAGRARGGVTEGGGSVCPFVSVSQKVIRPHWSDSRQNPPPVWAARFRERWGLGSDYRWIDKRSIPGG